MVLTQLPEGLREVDVILIGGGVTSSVIASRLSDADPELSVLVIEKGADNYNVPHIVHPALYRSNFDPTLGAISFVVGGQEEKVANRNIAIGTGSTLGGGSSVNALIYARGQSVDFDSWRTEGWTADDLIPYLKKLETCHPAHGGSTHGSNGPNEVSAGRFKSTLVQDDFISAAKRLGHPAVDDIQDLHSGNGVSPGYRFVSPTTGRRQDAAHVYLHPRLQNKSESANHNLHVLVETEVSRVLFDDDKRASAVEFRNNDTLHTVKARKLVIAAAGALSTPRILERSGVGGPKVLSKAGVNVVEPLVGVGHEYQDHQMLVMIYNSTLPIDHTSDSVINGALNVTDLLEQDAEILSWNGVDAYAKLRPTESEVDAFEPNLRAAWERDFAPYPEKPLGIVIPMSGILGDVSLYPTEDKYISMACYSAYPYSRGHVHITGPELGDAVDFNSGYLSDIGEVDVQILIWLYKKQREIARKMSMRREQVSTAPKFDDGSLASERYAFDPESSDEPVCYSQADNAAIEQWTRENVRTAFHPMSTCTMAPRDKNGVVDLNLSVYGVKGLKVADLSILPQNVAGNTMSTALLVGEKAADIFIKELGLDKS